MPDNKCLYTVLCIVFLLFSTSAISSSIPLPVTHDFSGRMLTLNNFSLNNQDNILTVKPGEYIEAKANWSVKTQNANIYCPGCTIQLYVGIDQQVSECLVSSVLKKGRNKSGNNTFKFAAPMEPGIYPIKTKWSLQYDCQYNTNFGTGENNIIGYILVDERVKIEKPETPKNLSKYGRHITVDNLTLNSEPLTIFSEPNEAINLKSSFLVDSSDPNTYCRDCLIQYYYGIRNNSSECIADRNFNNGEYYTDIDLDFLAPNLPGIYPINIGSTLQYNCIDGFQVPSNSSSAIGSVIIGKDLSLDKTLGLEWSANDLTPEKTCLNIGNNFLCHNVSAKLDLSWSSNEPVKNKKCVRMGNYSNSNKYACIDERLNIKLQWSKTEIAGQQCIHISDATLTNGLDDSYLCPSNTVSPLLLGSEIKNLTNSSSQFGQLLTVMRNELKLPLVKVNVITTNNDAPISYNFSYKNKTAPIGAININVGTKTRIEANDFWYIMAQGIVDSILGRADEALVCNSSSNTNYHRLSDVFTDNQSGNCVLREALAQILMQPLLDSTMQVSDLKRLVLGNEFIVGNNRRELLFFLDDTYAAAIGLVIAVEAVAHTIGEVIDKRKKHRSTAISVVYAIHQTASDQCSKLLGSCDPEDFLNNEGKVAFGIDDDSDCHTVEVGPDGNHYLDIASCNEKRKNICQGLNGIYTSKLSPIISATQACRDQDPDGVALGYESLNDEAVIDFLDLQSIDDIFGFEPKYPESCVVLERVGNDFYSNIEPVDCNEKRRILCESTHDIKDYSITSETYPLYVADEACANEFTEYSATGSDIYIDHYIATSVDSYSKNVDSSIQSLGTGVNQSSDGSRKRKRSEDDLDDDAKSIIPPLKKLKVDTESLTEVPGGYNVLLVSSINTGQGSCHAIKCIDTASGNSSTAIIDCGSSGRGQGSNQYAYDSSRTQLFFQGMQDILQGARNVITEGITISGDPNPTVIVSHPDKDHYNYIQTLMDGSGRVPGRIYLGGDYDGYLGFRNWLYTQYSSNNVLINNFLHSDRPAVSSWANNAGKINPNLFQSCQANLNLLTVNNGGVSQSKANRNSAVLQLTYKHDGDRFYSAIFPGDAEGSTEAAAKSRLAKNTAAYKHNILLASHHGAISKGSNGKKWINKIKPDTAIYSAGRHAGFGHPLESVVERYNLGLFLNDDAAGHTISVGNNNDNGRGFYFADKTVYTEQYSTFSSGTIISVVFIPRNPKGPLQPLHGLINSGPLLSIQH